MDNINEIAAEAALANAGTESVSHFAFELDNNNEGLHELAPGNGPISVAVSTRTFTDEEFGYATFQMIFGDADDELLQSPLMQNDDDRSTNNTPQPPPTAPNTPINFGALDVDMDMPAIPEMDMDMPAIPELNMNLQDLAELNMNVPVWPELNMNPPALPDQPQPLGQGDPLLGVNDGPELLFTVAQISRFM